MVDRYDGIVNLVDLRFQVYKYRLRDVDFGDFSIFDFVHPEMLAFGSRVIETGSKIHLCAILASAHARKYAPVFLEGLSKKIFQNRSWWVSKNS